MATFCYCLLVLFPIVGSCSPSVKVQPKAPQYKSAKQAPAAVASVAADRPQLAKAFKLLIPIAKEWQNMGILLELNDQDLKSIVADGDGDINHLREMLRLWLSQVDPPPSWEALHEAVKQFDSQIATKIKSQ